MSRQRVTQHSKRLSWLLRHGAREVGLAMDPAGWVDIPALLGHLRMNRATLDEVVRTNDKNRIQIEGERVRACQGHSKDAGVRLDALEASWAEFTGEDRIWHGTRGEVIPIVAREGLSPQQRTHVHLAAGLHSKVGKRAQVEIMLGVDPARVRDAGVRIYEAPNGVILARRIPAQAIVELRGMTRRGRAREAELRALLGL
ncbi:RNA 2'-phosphotransferase [Pseudenhygromyxa sp. WMMC2535]|nr:RNA 2'-phosphotransferase [Pseudenhygromyxa sp. WMMC2535]